MHRRRHLRQFQLRVEEIPGNMVGGFWDEAQTGIDELGGQPVTEGALIHEP